MRYLKGATGFGSYFSKNTLKEKALVGYPDSDHGENLDTRKSRTGFVFTLYGTTISWESNLQSVVALSTVEAEFIALTEAIKESLWLKGMAKELGVQQDSVVVHCDNQGAI